MVTETATVQRPALPRETVRRSAVVIEDKVRIPGWVDSLESFRQWARSGDMPEHGWFSYLDGELWVDLSMEQLFSHNRVKTTFTIVLGGLVETEGCGYFFSDRTLFSNPEAVLATEPDALFVTYDSVRSGRVRWVEGAEEGYVEVEGSPDLVLEIVSPTSVRKDTVTLRELYWWAGVREYWLVDARGEPPQFDIFRYEVEGYVATPAQEGWLRSEVLDREFRFTQQLDPLGHPQYSLAVRASGPPGSLGGTSA